MPSNQRAAFNSAAEHYHALRPHYPQVLFAKLITDAGLHAPANLLEIGPGTGQATKPLAKLGFNITAVELGADLANKARAELQKFANVNIKTGAFETVRLPADHYDLVYSATAIHWVKPSYRFTKPHQLLKTGGHLAIIHTEHVSDGAGDAFFFASQPIYQKYHPKGKDYKNHSDFVLPKLRNLQPPQKLDQDLFRLVSFAVFPVVVTYSAQEYIDLLATYSPHLALPKPKRQGFLNEVKDLINKQFGGQLTKHYGMTLTVAQKIG